MLPFKERKVDKTDLTVSLFVSLHFSQKIFEIQNFLRL